MKPLSGNLALSAPGSGLMSVLRQVQNKNNMADMHLRKTVEEMERELGVNLDYLEMEKLDWLEFFKQLKNCRSDDLTEFAPLLLSKLEEMSERPRKRTRFRDVFSGSDMGISDEAILLDLPRASLAEKLASLKRADTLPVTNTIHSEQETGGGETHRAATLPNLKEVPNEEESPMSGEEGKRPLKSRGEMRLAPIVASRPNTRHEKKFGIITDTQPSNEPLDGSTTEQRSGRTAAKGEERDNPNHNAKINFPPISGQPIQQYPVEKPLQKNADIVPERLPGLPPGGVSGVVGTNLPTGGEAEPPAVAEPFAVGDSGFKDCAEKPHADKTQLGVSDKKPKRKRKQRKAKSLENRIKQFFTKLEEEHFTNREESSNIPILPPIETAAQS